MAEVPKKFTDNKLNLCYTLFAAGYMAKTRKKTILLCNEMEYTSIVSKTGKMPEERTFEMKHSIKIEERRGLINGRSGD